MKFLNKFSMFSRLFNGGGTGKPNKLKKADFESCDACKKEFCQMGNNKFCRK